ncbi:5-formyltetrahydrofolate cyclo-ligase [Bacillus benzoevorans]|uniref:5-formyltetrahydrofolate cyclo-ligase n=1 Tax=Bacillus benzoevorans TaxID=1456 RepID=A0A7X0HQ85_9BACI|nr:5-formyltetrahydrofolate cyclo-ligase [Bacillus benzoevorans]MBB6444923.1 5-formyltetrahydrofolate cyclo-ligase [Bacillus benzoevorans]
MEKQKLRKEIRAKLKQIPKPLYEHYSYTIAQELYKDPLWQAASVIGITISIAPEVDTYQIIRTAWAEGKRVAVPKCHDKERTMDFRYLQRFNQLESVYFGLLEPIETETELAAKAEIDLLLVPGIAFTQQGYRMGVGGGYYDRFLEDFKGGTISLAFAQQIVPEIPVEEHDLPVGKIITNDGRYSLS